ncbi:GlxA family transcriptional regulator [Fulvimonas yonginensis]|uniref:Helix-turn-helix domain-containing protein n=1 Tax=Fulvimonas yonginensis TaxID=1495200 RepID=A0ABU8J7I6_9GAMM
MRAAQRSQHGRRRRTLRIAPGRHHHQIGAVQPAQAVPRRATTHWHWAEVFAARFPQVRLDPGVLYVDEGQVVTSAGTAAGIDCCLHLVRRLHGAEAANRVARRLVVPPHRQGSQAQYIEQPVPVRSTEGPLTRTLAWALRHLDQPLGLDRLAEHAAMSRRSFTRHFRKHTGTTVGRWLAAQRLALAQRLLETSRLPIERVAERAGFGTPLSLRQHFAATLHTTPSAYRRAFRQR